MFKLNQKEKYQNKKSGFILVELIVALFIFSIVILVSAGSIISIISANKKSQSLKSVMNNLNLALDSITKTLAVGEFYHCGPERDVVLPVIPLTEPLDCVDNQNNPSPDPEYSDQITFKSSEDLDENPTNSDYVTYFFTSNVEGGHIDRSVNFQSPAVRVTALDVDILDARFYVSGSKPFGAENLERQPKVFIIIKGQTGTDPNQNPTIFNIQTLVSQRIPDN